MEDMNRVKYGSSNLLYNFGVYHVAYLPRPTFRLFEEFRDVFAKIRNHVSSKKKKMKRNAEEEISNGQDTKRRKCPYLDTINPQLLDFDFEKVCSISLSDQNVYACLVCGKYFKGRGKNTHAFTHSVQNGHHVFINLSNDKIYCLPGMYVFIGIALNGLIVLIIM
jgi:uncharacterized UBP type Zn finger protein